MKLSVLLNRPAALLPCEDVEITGLALDSRTIRPGDCFFAYPGHAIDGRDFMKDVVNQAAVIVYDPEKLTLSQQEFLKSSPIPSVAFDHLAREVSHLAARFHGKPSEDQHVIAVTGTNGKSSIVHGLNQLYGMLNEPIAMIGTIGVGVLTSLKKAQLTTPDPVKLQELLKLLRDQGIENIAMEASSHALDQNRLNGVDIDVAILTQISRDHLDYHETMDEYVKSKAKLFKFKSVKQVVVNLDCPWFFGLIDSIPEDKVIIGYTLQDKTHPRLAALLKATDLEASLLGQSFIVHYLDKTYPVNTRLLGRFNISNILAMIAAMMADGFSLSEITALIPALETVPGRLDILRVDKQPLAVIDYAHTPDALEKVLQALRPLCHGQLICVFGCGGDRDKGKRPQMGAIAARLCDQVILTDDNPRTEDPKAIISDILTGVSEQDSIRIIHDRATAINSAIDQAHPDDCILIAGKGHETTQILKDKTLEFCDKTFTQHALIARSQK